jgi:outer membrane lipoprotein-sorting protein
VNARGRLRLLARGPALTAALACLAAALAPPAPARADGALRLEAGDVFQGMLEAEDKRAWMQADVVKTEQALGSAKAPAVTQGRLTSAEGGKARLVISSPTPGLIVADGKRLWVELAPVQQVMRYNETSLAA